jgi:CRISPR-associated protein Csb1
MSPFAPRSARSLLRLTINAGSPAANALLELTKNGGAAESSANRASSTPKAIPASGFLHANSSQLNERKNNMTKPTLNDLKPTVTGNAAAFRCRQRLQPGGGDGDKVFPPTYAGAVYAVEERRVKDNDGKWQTLPCVLMDSVHSQANRMEEALQLAIDTGRFDDCPIPLIEVDFSGADLLDDIQRVTSLQAPHRVADAILRDSLLDGVPFRDSEIGQRLSLVSLQNATPLYEVCPTALIFGMWDSTGPKGGLGAKFQRAVVSEIVGVNAQLGVRTASRLDPLIKVTQGMSVGVAGFRR